MMAAPITSAGRFLTSGPLGMGTSSGQPVADCELGPLAFWRRNDLITGPLLAVHGLAADWHMMFGAGVPAHLAVKFTGVDLDMRRASTFGAFELSPQFRSEIFDGSHGGQASPSPPIMPDPRLFDYGRKIQTETRPGRDGSAMVARGTGGADIEVKDFASQIYAAVRRGRLVEPFGPNDVQRACPGWAPKTYTVFLSKHRVGNPGKTTELFERAAPGLYRTLPKLRNSN
jgi:hypothetical protein